MAARDASIAIVGLASRTVPEARNDSLPLMTLPAVLDFPFYTETPAVQPQMHQFLEVAYEAVENAGIPISDIAGFRTSVLATCPSLPRDCRDGPMSPAADGSPSSFPHLAATEYIAKAFQLRELGVASKSPVQPWDECSPSPFAGLLAMTEALESLKAGTYDLAIVGEVQGKPFDAIRDELLRLDQRENDTTDSASRENENPAQSNIVFLVMMPLGRALTNGFYVHGVLREISNMQAADGTDQYSDFLVSSLAEVGLFLSTEKSNPSTWSSIPGFHNTRKEFMLQSHRPGGSLLRIQLEKPAGSVTLGEETEQQRETQTRIFVFSSEDADSCQAVVDQFTDYMESVKARGEDIALGDLAYTLANRRTRFPFVTAVRAGSDEELDARLIKASPPTRTHQNLRVGFVFNGQGAQWHAMGRELIDVYAVFKSAVLEADRLLKDLGAEWSFLEELLRDEQTTRVAMVEMSQSATVALQMCLVDLLRSWGLMPSAVTSHSSGEIAAAYAVGALSFQEAIGVAYFRDKLAVEHQLSSLGGSMLAVGLGLHDAELYLQKLETSNQVVVACINSPNNVTLSGDVGVLETLAARFESEGVFVRKLKVPIAHHSRHMDVIAQEYSTALQALFSNGYDSFSGWAKYVATYVSPVTGSAVTRFETIRNAEHWTNNLTRPVLFHEAMEALLSGSESPGSKGRESTTAVDVIVEIGPHSQLESIIRECLGGREVKYVSGLRRNVHAVETMQDAACELLQLGYPINLDSVNSPNGSRNKFLPGLPSYSWSRTRKSINQPICAKLVWEADLIHRLDAEAKDAMAIHLDDESLKYERKVQRASYYLINDAITRIQSAGSPSNNKEHAVQDSALYDWMKSVVACGKAGGLAPRSNTWAKASKGMKQKLFDELASGSPVGRSLVLVGLQLAEVICGETTVAKVLGSEELVHEYYEMAPVLQERSYKHLAKAVRCLAVKMPGARVLEIGPGAGVATRVVLEAFDAREDGLGSRLGSYSFAGTNSTHFDEESKRLARWSGILNFIEMDIASDLPVFPEAGAFDLIFTSLVHHNNNMSPRTWANLRKLLSPRGKLLMLVPTQGRLDMHILGIAPTAPVWGWGASHATVDRMLRDSSLNGVGFDIADCEETDIQSVQLLLSSAATAPPLSAPRISIVHSGDLPAEWLAELAASIGVATNSAPEIVSLHEALPHSGIVITTIEMESSSFNSIKNTDLENLRSLLDSSQGVLWLSRGHFTGTKTDTLKYAALISMTRTTHHPKRIVQLDFEDGIDIDTDLEIGHVLHVWRETLAQSYAEQTVQECTYVAKGSRLHVPRLYPEFDLGSCRGDEEHFSSEATYAVIGGTDVLCQVIVTWLVGKGATNIVLVSRGADLTRIHPRVIRRASQVGCNLQAHTYNVADEKEAIEFLKQVSQTLPPLRGIVYAADELRVGAHREADTAHSSVLNIKSQRESYLENGSPQGPSGAEILGSLNLHYHAPDVDFFIILSSAASPAGHRTFQQRLVQQRAEHNLPAHALCLGSSTSDATVRRMLDAAISTKTTGFIFDSGEDVIRGNGPRTCPSLGTLIEAIDRIQPTSDIEAAPSGAPLDHDTMLQNAVTVSQVVETLRSKISSATGEPNVDPTLPISNQGVDSLVASELRNWLSRCTGVNVSILDILRSSSMHDLGNLLVARWSDFQTRNNQ